MRELGTTYTAAERAAIAARRALTASPALKPDDGSTTPPHGDPLASAIACGDSSMASSVARGAGDYLLGYADGLDGHTSEGCDDWSAAYVDGRVAGERERARRAVA